MATKVKAVPDGMHTVTPVLKLKGCAEAMEFFKRAFGAEEVMRAPDPSGKQIMHASMRIGDSMIYLNDEMPQLGETAHPTALWLYVQDVDAAFKRAVDAGATVKMPPADMFWGDRFASVTDRWGNSWGLAQHIKDLTPAELQRAQDEFFATMAAQK